jgi:alkaline phosphatase
MKRILVLTMMLLVLSLVTPAIAQHHPSDRDWDDNHEVKYVIFMVPDGMGLADVTAARLRKNGPSGAPLALETLEQIGYQRTYSADNTITDSAAAGSAWSCGEKFANGEICFHANGRPNNPTLLELAKWNGMATGLVAISTITHATPQCSARISTREAVRTRLPANTFISRSPMYFSAAV